MVSICSGTDPNLNQILLPFSAESRIKQLEAELVQLQETNKELIIDMEGCSKRESEHLIFSQKMSDKNAQLQSENNSLSHKVSSKM